RVILPVSVDEQSTHVCSNAGPRRSPEHTRESNEYMKEDFLIKIETWHKPDLGTQENVHKLEPETWKHVEAVYIDIADRSQVLSKDYKAEEDPAKFKSIKTGRGPLGPNWKQELVNQKDCPYMCAYKLVTVKFKWWGLQNKVENFIHKQEKRLFTNFHRQLFCWLDKWVDLTMDDIRRMEEETKRQLDEFCKTVVNRKAQQLHPPEWQAVFGCSLSVLLLQATFNPLLNLSFSALLLPTRSESLCRAYKKPIIPHLENCPVWPADAGQPPEELCLSLLLFPLGMVPVLFEAVTGEEFADQELSASCPMLSSVLDNQKQSDCPCDMRIGCFPVVLLEQGWTDLGPSEWLTLTFIEVLSRPGNVPVTETSSVLVSSPCGVFGNTLGASWLQTKSSNASAQGLPASGLLVERRWGGTGQGVTHRAGLKSRILNLAFQCVNLMKLGKTAFSLGGGVGGGGVRTLKTILPPSKN
ncbi:hypothetical protein A6R68_22409, partial [Neotoma lepida]